MWPATLQLRLIAIGVIATVLVVIVWGIYRLGGAGQRAADAVAVVKELKKEKASDAKRDKAAPVNAGDAVIDSWLLHYTYN